MKGLGGKGGTASHRGSGGLGRYGVLKSLNTWVIFPGPEILICDDDLRADPELAAVAPDWAVFTALWSGSLLGGCASAPVAALA